MIDPKVPAMQLAIMHAMLKANPGSRADILQLADFYKETFFVDGGNYLDAVSGALDHMVRVVEVPDRCDICRCVLDDPKDEATRNCGGTCLRCMASLGYDPECIAALHEIENSK